MFASWAGKCPVFINWHTVAYELKSFGSPVPRIRVDQNKKYIYEAGFYYS